MTTRDTAWPAGTPCWVDISAADPDTLSRFYADLLGWEFEVGGPETGGYLQAQVGGRSVAGIGGKGPGMEGAPTFWGTYLATDDMAASVAAVTAAGGSPLFEPMEIMGLGTMVFATDPSGAGFGLWQSGSMTGFQVANEPGSVSWNELHTGDYANAKEFYTAVAGIDYEVMGDTDDFRYSTMKVGGQDVGGVMEDHGTPPGVNAYWLTYFAVADTDASEARALELGATVMMPATDTPYGRMAILMGPESEIFALIEPAAGP